MRLPAKLSECCRPKRMNERYARILDDAGTFALELFLEDGGRLLDKVLGKAFPPEEDIAPGRSRSDQNAIIKRSEDIRLPESQRVI